MSVRRATITVSVDLRESTDLPTASVAGHRSVSGEAVHVRLVLGEGVVVLLNGVQAETAMMRLATAAALARQPKRGTNAKRPKSTEAAS